jgi:hypothetical protein
LKLITINPTQKIMKSHQPISAVLTGVSLLTMAFGFTPATEAVTFSNSSKVALSTAPVICSPVRGTWSHDGKGIPIGQEIRRPDRIVVNMSAFRRPTARGRILSNTQIEVNFPDDGTFIGTLDGQGKISWNNGTQWQATIFYGSWFYEGKRGPNISKASASDNRLKIDMSKYSRPTAYGDIISPSQATFEFTDDATHTATLVSPSCMKWSNGTMWTK